MFSSKQVAALFLAGLFAATSASAFDLVPGDIVIADRGATTGSAVDDGAVLVVPGAGGPAEEVIASGSGLEDPVSIAIEGTGSVLVLDASTLEVYRVNPDAETFGTVIPAAAGLVAPTAIALDVAGRILVLDGGFSTPAGLGALLLYLPNGTFQVIVSGGQQFLNGPIGMTVEASGTIAVTVDNGGAGLVVRVDPASPLNANQTGLSNVAPIASPTGIDTDASGNFIFGDTGLVLGLASAGGTAFPVSIAGPPNTGYATPTGIRVEPSGNVIAVDSTTTLVSRIDPTPPPAPNSNQTNLAAAGLLAAPTGVDIATVPEPTAILAQGTALLVLGLVAARRRRA